MLVVNGKEIKHSNKKYVQDSDCHWYVIHKDDVELFNNLDEEYANLNDKYWASDEEEQKNMKDPELVLSEFEEKFENGRTGGSMDLLDPLIQD